MAKCALKSETLPGRILIMAPHTELLSGEENKQRTRVDEMKKNDPGATYLAIRSFNRINTVGLVSSSGMGSTFLLDLRDCVLEGLETTAEEDEEEEGTTTSDEEEEDAEAEEAWELDAKGGREGGGGVSCNLLDKDSVSRAISLDRPLAGVMGVDEVDPSRVAAAVSSSGSITEMNNSHFS